MLDHEIVRVHDHLAGAERQVRSRGVSHLPLPVQRLRKVVVEALAGYRRARRYPHNHVQEAMTPVFIDEHGTRCAMAHLLELVGAHALVARVAATNNLARIHDLASDPELLTWLSAMGLTVDEAARIQPSYSARRSWCWCDHTDQPASEVVTASYVGPADGGVARYRVDVVHGGSGVAVGDTIEMGVGYVATVPKEGWSGVVAIHRKDASVYGRALPKDRYNFIDCTAVAKTFPVPLEEATSAVLSTTCNATLVAKYPELGKFESWPPSDASPPPPADTGTLSFDTGSFTDDTGSFSFDTGSATEDTGIASIDSGVPVSSDAPPELLSGRSCSMGSAAFGFAPLALVFSAAVFLRLRQLGR